MDFSTTNMLIHIDIQKSDLSDSFCKEPAVVSELFSEIARASKRGTHRFVLSEYLASWVVTNVELDQYSAQQIIKIGQKYSILGGLLKENHPLLKVVLGNMDFQSEGNDQWVIGHKILIAGEYLAKTKIVVEGLSDMEVYRFLLVSESTRAKFGPTNMEIEQGGGKSMHINFRENISKNKRITICICDSERLVPGGLIGESCKEVLKAAEELNCMDLIKCTPGADAENFLPIDIVKTACKGNYNKAATRNLEKLIDRENDDLQLRFLWLFYKIKKPISSKLLQDNCKNACQMSWVKNTYAEFFPDKLDELPVFSSKVIYNFLEDEDLKVKYIKEFMNGPYWGTHFANWVSTLLWYTCGENETST